MDEHIFMFHVLDMQPKKLIDNVFQLPDGLKSAELCAQIQDQDWEKVFCQGGTYNCILLPQRFLLNLIVKRNK